MFRTRVIYLWLHMIGAFGGLLLAAVVATALFLADDSVLLLPFLVLPLALGGCALAIFGSFPMMALMQRLLVAVGNRSGRPAEPGTFRRYLLRYSLVPAALPLLLLVVPRVREAGWPVLMPAGLWALATVLVWRWYARRLYAEWEVGRAY